MNDCRKVHLSAYGSKINCRKTYATKLCCLIPTGYEHCHLFNEDEY